MLGTPFNMLGMSKDYTRIASIFVFLIGKALVPIWVKLQLERSISWNAITACQLMLYVSEKLLRSHTSYFCPLSEIGDSSLYLLYNSFIPFCNSFIYKTHSFHIISSFYPIWIAAGNGCWNSCLYPCCLLWFLSMYFYASYSLVGLDEFLS